MDWSLSSSTAFGVYALGLGLLIVGVVLFYLNRGLSSQRWPALEARVTASSVAEDSDGQCSVSVTYTYSVGDETYVRSETLTVCLPTRENAEQVRERHPVGGAVEVRYNPSRPHVAVLRPGASVWLLPWLVIGAGITVAGAVLLTGNGFAG
jgi:hypothetical protein